MSQNITQLQSALEQKKNQYRTETTFNADELQKRKSYQRSHILLDQPFRYDTLKELLCDFSVKIDDGYTFTFEQQAQHSPQAGAYIRLLKPKAMLETEYTQSDIQTEQQYLSELEELKTSLLHQIAQATVDVQIAVEAEKVQVKRESDFERALKEVTKELLADQSKPTTKKR